MCVCIYIYIHTHIDSHAKVVDLSLKIASKHVGVLIYQNFEPTKA